MECGEASDDSFSMHFCFCSTVSGMGGEREGGTNICICRYALLVFIFAKELHRGLESVGGGRGSGSDSFTLDCARLYILLLFCPAAFVRPRAVAFLLIADPI